MRFHHTTQNSMQFKIYELFISEIYHLIFWGHIWPWVTETKKKKTTHKGYYCIMCLSIDFFGFIFSVSLRIFRAGCPFLSSDLVGFQPLFLWISFQVLILFIFLLWGLPNCIHCSVQWYFIKSFIYLHALLKFSLCSCIFLLVSVSIFMIVILNPLSVSHIDRILCQNHMTVFH